MESQYRQSNNYYCFAYIALLEPSFLLNTENNKKGWLCVYKDFIVEDKKFVWDLELVTEPPIVVYGKKCIQHRCVGFYSNTSGGYKFSGQTTSVYPMTDQLKMIMDVVNEKLGTDFNGVLINKYRNGADNIGKHSDDESGLSKVKPCVASLSFGATRTFRIRDKETGKIVLDYPHKEGELLVMFGNFQSHYTHEIPKQLKVTEPRISLTFRNHIH
jgi:alkylated DNA repair dioxygenase AlkB